MKPFVCSKESVVNQIHHVIICISLTAAMVLNSAWALEISAQSLPLEASDESTLCQNLLRGRIFSRTELYFGLSRPGGPDVTEEEFQDFVDTEVTPRFPDGLTLITGKGQYKNIAGTILQENTKVLILFYPFNLQRNRAVEQIRKAYKERFQQEAVLRTDGRSCVSF